MMANDTSRELPAGRPLAPIAPDERRDDIVMDFIGPLPIDQGFNSSTQSTHHTDQHDHYCGGISARFCR